MMGDLPKKGWTKPDKSKAQSGLQKGSTNPDRSKAQSGLQKGSTNPDKSKEQSGPTTKNDFLVVPSNPISGGSSIPVGIQITAASLANLARVPAKDLSVTQSTIELFWENQAIATVNLPMAIFNLITGGQDIHVSTRLKVPNNVTKGTLTVNVIMNVMAQGQPKPLTKSELASLLIEASDNAPVTIGQLVLSLQPAQSALKDVEMVAVKAIVPKPQLKTRVLQAIDGAVRDLKNPPAGDPPKLITMTIKAPDLLSDEVFLGFNFIPSKPTMLEMSWTYNKDDVSQNLIATACLLG
jgi:hypothetical protein